jgi:hypothetical protein
MWFYNRVLLVSKNSTPETALIATMTIGADESLENLVI